MAHGRCLINMNYLIITTIQWSGYTSLFCRWGNWRPNLNNWKSLCQVANLRLEHRPVCPEPSHDTSPCCLMIWKFCNWIVMLWAHISQVSSAHNAQTLLAHAEGGTLVLHAAPLGSAYQNETRETGQQAPRSCCKCGSCAVSSLGEF